MTSLSYCLLLLSTQTDVTALLHLSSSLEWSLLPAGRMGGEEQFSCCWQGPNPDPLHWILTNLISVWLLQLHVNHFKISIKSISFMMGETNPLH